MRAKPAAGWLHGQQPTAFAGGCSATRQSHVPGVPRAGKSLRRAPAVAAGAGTAGSTRHHNAPGCAAAQYADYTCTNDDLSRRQWHRYRDHGVFRC